MRNFYGDLGGSQAVAVGTGDTTLATCKTNHTVFVQRLHLQVTTGSSGKTWSIEDSNGVSITGPIPCDTAPMSIELDYGPIGIALSAGYNLVLNVSAAGAIGLVTWDAYQKLTTVAAA